MSTLSGISDLTGPLVFDDTMMVNAIKNFITEKSAIVNQMTQYAEAILTDQVQIRAATQNGQSVTAYSLTIDMEAKKASLAQLQEQLSYFSSLPPLLENRDILLSALDVTLESQPNISKEDFETRAQATISHVTKLGEAMVDAINIEMYQKLLESGVSAENRTTFTQITIPSYQSHQQPLLAEVDQFITNLLAPPSVTITPTTTITPTITPTANTTDPLSSVIQRITQNFQTERDSIDRIEQIVVDLAYKNAEIAEYESALYRYGPNSSALHRAFYNYAQRHYAAPHARAVAERNEIQAELQEIQARLEAINPSYKALGNSLTALIAGLKSVAQNRRLFERSFKADIERAVSYIREIGKAIEEKLLADSCRTLMEDTTNGLTDAQRAELAQRMIQHLSNERSILYSLIDKMASDIVNLVKEANQARVKKAGIHWYNEAFRNKNKYRDIIKNAEMMIGMIQNVMKELRPEVSSLSPNLIQMINTINSIVKKIIDILGSTTLSPEQKGEQIMSLMVFALGLLSTIISLVAKEKAESEKRMNESSVHATKMNIDNEVSQHQIMKKMREYGRIMKIVVRVAVIAMGIGMMIAAPGVGTTVVMATIVALEASGALDKLTKKLATAIGSKAGAEAIIAVIEVVLTFGGGAVLDALMKKLAQAAQKAIMKAIAASLQSSIKETVATIMLKSPGLNQQVVEQIVTTTITNAAQQAAAKTFTLFTRQSGALVLKSLAGNGLATRNIAAAIETSMKEAAESAITKASKRVVPLVEKAAPQAAVSNTVEAAPLAEEAATASLGKATLDEMGQIARTAANESAAATTRNKTAEQVAVMARETSTKWTKAGRVAKTASVPIYAATSNNLFVELTKSLLKANGKDSEDDEYQQVMMAMSILQEIMSMIALLVGSGIMSSVALSGTPSIFFKMMNAGDMLGAAANTTGAYGVGDSKLGESNAVKAVAQANASIDTFQFILEQLKREGNAERARVLKEISQSSRTTTRLASHTDDSGAIAARMIAEYTV